ncbi:MAG: hypothetical protein DDT25_00829 [Chloroflexi bacterium]|nr:hypothetical protein [Chloroflexota bacterium]MBT9166155.1 hypothetical protein [Chloroflexota bacterium]
MNTQPKGTKTKGFKIIVGVTALVVVVVAAITLYFAPYFPETVRRFLPHGHIEQIMAGYCIMRRQGR